MTAERFWTWFELETKRHGYRSVREVERAGGVGNDTISGRQRRGASPTATVIRAIAQAFGLPFEAVQQMADEPPVERHEADDHSVAPDTGSASLTLRELWGIVSEMPVADQRAVLDYALFRRSRTGGRQAEKPRRAPSTSPQIRSATDGG